MSKPKPIINLTKPADEVTPMNKANQRLERQHQHLLLIIFLKNERVKGIAASLFENNWLS